MEHDLPRVTQHSLARHREANASPITYQQLGAQFLLKPPDRHRQRRLRHVQALGCAAEVQRFR